MSSTNYSILGSCRFFAQLDGIYTGTNRQSDHVGLFRVLREITYPKHINRGRTCGVALCTPTQTWQENIHFCCNVRTCSTGDIKFNVPFITDNYTKYAHPIRFCLRYRVFFDPTSTSSQLCVQDIRHTRVGRYLLPAISPSAFFRGVIVEARACGMHPSTE